MPAFAAPLSLPFASAAGDAMSLARAKLDFGQRVQGYQIMIEVLQQLGAGKGPDAAFLPPTLRHEALGGDARGWLETACLEVVERTVRYSTFYGPALPQLEWLCGTRFSTYELERRRALSAVVRGKTIQLRKDLSKPAPDHLNAEIWAKLIGQ